MVGIIIDREEENIIAYDNDGHKMSNLKKECYKTLVIGNRQQATYIHSKHL